MWPIWQSLVAAALAEKSTAGAKYLKNIWKNTVKILEKYLKHWSPFYCCCGEISSKIFETCNCPTIWWCWWWSWLKYLICKKNYKIKAKTYAWWEWWNKLKLFKTPLQQLQLKLVIDYKFSCSSKHFRLATALWLVTMNNSS